MVFGNLVESGQALCGTLENIEGLVALGKPASLVAC